jgi:hypothetical protein
MRAKMRRCGIVLAACILAISLAACGTSPSSGVFLTPIPTVIVTPQAFDRFLSWRPFPELAAAQNAEGLFSVKVVALNAERWLFFYALQSAHKGAPGVTAATVPLDSMGAGSGQSLTVEQVQPLGTLGDLDIGVIRVTWEDRPKQVLVLQVTPAGATRPAWQVAPGQQLGTTGDNVYWAAPGAPTNLTVEDEANMRAGTNPVGIFRLVLAPPGAPGQVFLSLKVDRQAGTVSPIGEAEFTTLRSQLSLTPVPPAVVTGPPASPALPGSPTP